MYFYREISARGVCCSDTTKSVWGAMEKLVLFSEAIAYQGTVQTASSIEIHRLHNGFPQLGK